MKRTPLIGLALLLALGSNLQADEVVLDEVVVTATRTEQDPAKVTATVDVVRGEELERSGAATIDEAFRRMPGMVNDRTAGPAGLSDQHGGIVMRGFNRADNVLVLVNGHPVNNYEGEVQWWNIPMESVERVEVVRGPSSSLYGGGAVAGVVNIITKEQGSPLYYSMGFGSYGTKNIALGSSNKVGDLTYRIDIRSQNSNGHREEVINYYNNPPIGGDKYDPPAVSRIVLDAEGGIGLGDDEAYYLVGERRVATDNKNLSTSFKWDMTDDQNIAFGYDFSKYEWIPDVAKDSDGNDISGSVKEQETHRYAIDYYNMVSDNAELMINGGLVNNKEDYWKMSLETRKPESYRPNHKYNLGMQSNIYLPANNTLSVGVDSTQSMVDSEWGDQLISAKMRTVGVYMQDQWDALDNLSLVGSLRYDYWLAYDAKGSVDDEMIQYQLHQDNVEHYLSPRLGLSYRPDEQTVLKFSTGDAFRAPNLWDMYSYTYIPTRNRVIFPNPALKPETSRSVEVSAERSLIEGLKLGATYFYYNNKDLIYRVDHTSMMGTDGQQNQNIGRSYSRGYELFGEYLITDGVELWGNATYTDAKITKAPYNQPELRGKRIAEVPKYTFNLGSTFEYKGFYTDLIYRYMGDRYATTLNTDVIDNRYGGYDEYGVMDINLGYDGDNFAVKTSVYNVFNREYWENNGKNPGRAYMLSFTAKF